MRCAKSMTTQNLHKSFHFSIPLLCFLLLCLWGGPLAAKQLLPFGVVLDLNSSFATMAQSCMTMALQDFYEQHAHYNTRLVPRFRSSEGDVVAAAAAAFDLINKEKVLAIIGPQTSEQARFVIELGRKARVPIISFSATSPSLSPTRNPYFIRTAPDDSSQVEAIAAIVEAYRWYKITLIYEDTEYGNGLIPYLNDALVKIDTRVPYRSVINPNSEEPAILGELKKLKLMHARIFLVHMTAQLGSKFFLAAKKAEMMSEGYAWLVTQGLSAELDPMDPEVVESMQGVLGVRPMEPKANGVVALNRRWKATGEASTTNSTVVTPFGLWAYDTVWALAMAVEKVGIENSNFRTQNVSLVNAIRATKFRGPFGSFNLVKGQLEPSTLEIFNVIEQTESVIGYWIPQRGLSPDLVGAGDSISKGEKVKLKQPKWPGNATEQPPKLRIGIPERNVDNDFKKVKNFSFDVFYEVLKVLPFHLNYEFIYFGKNGVTAVSYNELIMTIKNKTVDAVVGDITIVANRSNYVDFTMPFSESRVRMVVSVEHDKRQDMWIFLKPLSLDLWLTTGAAFIFTGFIVWFLEHRTNTAFRGTPKNQVSMVLWFSFSTLVFAHKEKVVNNFSRFVLVVWVFVVLIITQSYTASLASILTVQRLQPAFLDIKEIQKKGYRVGFQRRCFVRGLLINDLGFNESNLIPLETPQDYHDALSLGNRNGGVAAVFDEVFNINIFLDKYGSRYKMVGPTYKTDGLGFAFSQNSPLVSHFSRAILEVTEDKDKFNNILSKYFSSKIIFEEEDDSTSSDSASLTVQSFGGLFIITIVVSLLSLLFKVLKFLYSKWRAMRTIHSHQVSFWATMAEIAKHLNQKDSSLHPPNRSDSVLYPAATLGNEASLAADGMDNQSRTHSEEVDTVAVNEENGAMLSSEHSGMPHPS